MNNSQSENFSELARLQKSTTTLQRELATRNEVCTYLSLVEELYYNLNVTTTQQLFKQTIRKLKTQSSKSGNTSQATAAPVKKRENVSSPTPPAADITTLIKQCVTQRRVRVYLSFVFIVLFLLFSFYSTRSITQENELLECQRQLKIKYSDPNARGGL